jgi:hypothetical protein
VDLRDERMRRCQVFVAFEAGELNRVSAGVENAADL